jgi:ribosomal protein S18 acetylase RimI-like enzyme
MNLGELWQSLLTGSSAWPNVLSALAGTASAFLAFKTVRASERQSASEANSMRSLATMEFVTDNSRHLSTMRRAAFQAKLNYLRGRQQSDDPALQLWSENGEASDLGFQMQPLQNVHPRASRKFREISRKNQSLRQCSYTYDETPHTEIAVLFNRLEEISAGVRLGVFDIDTLDSLYGGLIKNSYRQFSDWVSWLRRHLGGRFFDQLDLVLDELIIRDTAIFKLSEPRALAHLLIRARIKLVKDILSNRDLRKQLTQKQTLTLLTRYGLSHSAQRAILRSAKNTQLNFDATIRTTIPARRSVKRLFEMALIESENTWPVALASTSGQTNTDTESWLRHVEDTSSCYLVCFARRWGGLRKTVVGFLAVSDGDEILQQKARWQSEFRSATKGLSRSDLLGLSLPLEKADDTDLDLSKVAQIRYFYVHPDYRGSSKGQGIGRMLLRQALRYIRSELNKTPMLSVLADTHFTAAAVRLYRAEGGHYLGTYRDLNDPKRNLLHQYIF